MKLSIIFPVLNQHPLARTALDFAIKNLSGERDVEILIIDNASSAVFRPYNTEVTKMALFKKTHLNAHIESTEIGEPQKYAEVKTIRLDKNIGVYPIFWEALKYTSADVLAYLHSDLIVEEEGWDKRIIDAFENNQKLGLVGFIGSNQIDNNGGRGAGTTSNFMGYSTNHRDGLGKDHIWHGSPAGAHGKRDEGYTKAAVVDGCAMIFRRTVLELITQRQNFPPHHFYDRLLSCETRENGWEMAVIGIGCDHISGQTVNQEPAYSVMAEAWALEHGLTMEGVHNWDSVLYREAETQWIKEYRDTKHLIPCQV